MIPTMRTSLTFAALSLATTIDVFTQDASCFAQEKASAWTLEQKIPLENVKGRFDHFGIDQARQRLFLAASDNNTVEVIDLAGGKRLQELEGFKEPQGVFFNPDTKELVVTSAGDGKCRFYNDDLKLVATVEELEDADNIRYDPKTKRLYVAFGAGAIAAIDATNHKKLGGVTIKKHPEAFQLEQNGPRIFVDVPDTQDVVVIDREKMAVIGKWPIKGQDNFPLAFDEASQRAFIGCRKPPKLFVLDTESGKTLTSLACCGDPDDVWYDSQAKRVYVSCGEGAIGVFEPSGTDAYKETTRVPTAKGARTSLFVPETRTFYLAVPQHGKYDARVDVYKVSAKS